MSDVMRCVGPKCNNAPLRKIEMESSFTAGRYVCMQCGRAYTAPTAVGKISQVAPLATAVAIIGSILLGNWDDLPDLLE